MTFSYALTSRGSRDRVRLRVGDTASASYSFEDEELDDFLSDQGGDINLAAAQALRVLAADRAKFAVYYQVQGFSMDKRDAVRLLLEAADRLASAARGAPYEFESVTEFFTDVAGRDLSNYADTEEAT